MATDLSAAAKERGIKYFLISYTDLFGTQRAKLVPAAAIKGMAKSGAGFAGFATWLDMTPADPDLFAVPDPDSLIQLPWKPEVGWLAADLWMDGKLVEQSPRNLLKRLIAERRSDLGRRRPSEQALLRPVGADAALRLHQGAVRRDAVARLESVSERP
jgi:glutamine synthetase